MPEESLLIQKSVGSVPHTGGKRFELDSEYAQTLLRWHRAGAANDPGEVPAVTKVEIYPPARCWTAKGHATAHRAGQVLRRHRSRCDSLAVFLSNNDNSAPISADGVVTAANRGEAFIMAASKPTRSARTSSCCPKGLQFAVERRADEFNYIDELHARQASASCGSMPSEVCSDEEFLRRATWTSSACCPPSRSTTQFMADTDPEKREKLVDELLDRKEFVEMWVMKWAELLQIRTTQQISYKPMLRYYNWLQEQARQQRADRPDGPGAAWRQRRHVRQRGHQLLPESKPTR